MAIVTATGVSNGDRQIIFSINAPPPVTTLEITNRPDLTNEKLGYAVFEYQRLTTTPFISLGAVALYGQGGYLRPGTFPNVGNRNRLVIYWLYTDMNWRVLYDNGAGA